MGWVTQVTETFSSGDSNPITDFYPSWTAIFGLQSVKVLSGVATLKGTSDTDQGNYYSGRTWANDQSSSAIITIGAGGTGGSGLGVGFCVRMASGARTGYRFTIDHAVSNNARVSRWVAGTPTTLDTWTQTFTDGDRFMMRVSGPASAAVVEILRAGSVVRTLAADNSSVASGSPGIEYSADDLVSFTWDDWEGGELVADDILTHQIGALSAVGW